MLPAAAALALFSRSLPVRASTLVADISAPASTADWACLRGLGVSGGIVRAWSSMGAPDTLAPGSLKAAHAAGISDTAVYMFPCAGKRDSPAHSAAAQVNGTVAALASAGVASLVQRFWIDVESNPSPGCGWSTDLASNCAWVQELVDAVRAAGQHVGIYSSHYEWALVAGGACELRSPASIPLWYAHYDGDDRTCSDYEMLPFGGWTAPYLKQYNDHLPAGCNIGADASIVCGATQPPPATKTACAQEARLAVRTSLRRSISPRGRSSLPGAESALAPAIVYV